MALINPLTHTCGTLGLIFKTQHFIQCAYYIISVILHENFIFFTHFLAIFVYKQFQKLQMSPTACTVLHPSVF